MPDASVGAAALLKRAGHAKGRDEYAIREAAFLSLCHADCVSTHRLAGLTEGEWRKLLHWLDVSGLALYFADYCAGQDQFLLPEVARDCLQQNLADNRVRIGSLLRESALIQAEFQRKCLLYAVVKGFSLYPSSVPRLELRHQLDLDFLVHESCASEARLILERAGYCLHAISGKSWEFKKNLIPRLSTKDMYKDGFGHSVELHIETVHSSQTSVLNRVEHRTIEGVSMPVLAPADIFLGQALHLFKDLCSPAMRAAHLLEFHRHQYARYDDAAFWSQVHGLVQGEPTTVLRTAVVLRVMEAVVRVDVPRELATWTIHDLPAGIDRWVTLYGRRSVYGTPPGTKLYLILQREMELAGVPFKRPVCGALLPKRLPQAIVPASENETIAFRVRRYVLQFRFVLMRSRFHLLEGMRYAWEAYRWKLRASADTPRMRQSRASFSTK